MKKIFIAIIALFTLLVIGNATYVSIPSWSAKSNDPRNEKVTILAHLRWGIDPTTLVIDVLDIEPTASMMDVDRSLFDIADALKGRSFQHVELAFRGKSKFRMKGTYFRTIGLERNFQNPVYTIRTMAENIQNLNGSPAFSTWTGGLLGVMGRQMEDHNELHQRWYIEAL
ncbi:hypothetical protein ACWF50_09740 [Brucella pseudogrignonensis]